MPPASTSRHQLIHDAFASPAGADVDVVASTTLQLWRQIAAHFEPLIGVGSVNLIFARCIDLNRGAYPWLQPIVPLLKATSPFADHHADLLTQTAAEASRASAAVLIAFAETLDALIGEHLTSLYLRPLLKNAKPTELIRRTSP